MTDTLLPADSQRALNEAARLLQQGRPGEALAVLLPLFQEHPHNVDLAINVGGAYILQRKWDRAVRVLAEAAERHPDNAMVWTNLGAAYLGRLETAGPRQQQQAIGAYERALQADPTAPNVHYHLGLIYRDRGELNRASAFFQRALEVNPGDRDAQYWLDQLGRQMAAEQRRRIQDKLQGRSAETDASTSRSEEDA